MVAQVMYVQKELDKDNLRLSHIVVMGTGEPFDNYDNVMNFLATVNHDRGLGIGSRHITISTCGIVPRIYDFANEHTQYNLAISLHAPNDELRDKLMPVNHAYPLKELMEAVKYYGQENNRRLTFEYILLNGVNDRPEHAKQLSKLLHGMNAYVNLIPYNAVDEKGFKSVSHDEAMVFYDLLMKNHVRCTIRKEHGNDIDAACGQLRIKEIKRKEFRRMKVFANTDVGLVRQLNEDDYCIAHNANDEWMAIVCVVLVVQKQEKWRVIQR